MIANRITYLFLISFTLCLGLNSLAQKQEGSKMLQQEKDKIESTVQFFEGMRQKGLGENNLAQSAFKKCIELNPNNDAAYFELSQIALSASKFNEALSFMQAAQKLSPNNPFYLEFLGQIHIELNQAKEALKIYELLNKKYPGNPEYLLSLGSINERLSRTKQADEYYNEAQNLSDDPLQILEIRLRNFVNANKANEAINLVKELLHDYPDQLFYQNFLADLYLFTKNFGEAEKIWHQLADEAPYYSLAALKLAKLQAQQGDIVSSLKYGLKAMADPELDIDSKMELILGYLGNYKKHPELKVGLVELTKQMATTHPGDAKAYAALGDALNNGGELSEARNAYIQSVQLAPSKHQIWAEIANIDLSLGDSDSLISHSQKAIELFPNLPQFYYCAGIAYLQKELHSEAISALENCASLLVEKNELMAQVFSFLGDSYHAVGEHKKSDDSYEKSLKIRPNDAHTLNNYSYYLSLRKTNLNKAKEMAQNATRIEPENPNFLDTYAWVLYQLSEFAEAKTLLDKTLKLAPPSSEVLEHYGDVLFQLGQLDGAVEFWQKALDSGKGSPGLQLKISTRKMPQP